MVRRLTSPRLEFEAAAIYEYPEHLRSFLNDLPTRPGVYLFHGESDTMPLYIGKSVNIRSRVLSHLRTRMKPPCCDNPDASAGYVPPVKSALYSLKRD